MVTLRDTSADCNWNTTTLALMTPHIARGINIKAITYKQKGTEGNYLSTTPGLLAKK
jgi:hypothetical protein